jgi:hypothetical protein
MLHARHRTGTLASTIALVAFSTGAAFAAMHRMQDAPSAADAASNAASTAAWPQTVVDAGDTITVYQPQFETLDGVRLSMKAAVSVRRKDSDGALASLDGIAALSAQTVAGDVPGEVEVNGITCASVDFGGAADDEMAARLSRLLAGVGFTVDRGTLVEDMQLANARAAGTPGLSFTPPRFVDSNVSAVLVTIDGPPILVPAGSTGWQSVKNSAFIVLKSPEGRWYAVVGGSTLAGGAVSPTWMCADSLQGTYASCDAPPSDVVAALGTTKETPEQLDGQAPSGAQPSATPKRIVVATEPTVLIAIDGTPKLVDAAPGVREVTNANCVLLHVASPSEWWTLQAGRWFHAAPGTPWRYAAPGEVPASFAQLAARGRLTSARASVPGTTEAKAAVVASSEVRTVTVKADASCDVKYAGEPAFKPSAASGDAANVGYATNASQPVLGFGKEFYCCDAAAWFVSTSATGPWKVADSIPSAIYSIPPSCPVYPVTYVEVYGSTKDASTGALTSVTFGFTSGYLGTYLNEGTPVYGTGYDYSPETDAPAAAGTYQSMPQTYGSGASYDDQTGTYAPSGYSPDYSYATPVVQPYYLDQGWGGWGWCPGWSCGWGWGYNNWWTWNNWSGYWNSWHPYWNSDWHDDWQRNHRVYSNARATNALAQQPANNPWKESSDWQKWNAANAAGDEPQNKEPADWQKWNAANAAGNEPQDKTPADWQKWNANDPTYANNAQRAQAAGRAAFNRNQNYNWNQNRANSTYGRSGWSAPNARSTSYPNGYRSWNAYPRTGTSGFHPSYNYNYRPAAPTYRAPVASHRGGGGGGRR